MKYWYTFRLKLTRFTNLASLAIRPIFSFKKKSVKATDNRSEILEIIASLIPMESRFYRCHLPNLTAMGQCPGQKKQKPFIRAVGLKQIITNLRVERQIVNDP